MIDGLSTAIAAGVATVTIDRAESRNALSLELLDALAAELERLDADSEARCIVLTGNEDYFATGADIGALVTEANRAEHDPETSFWKRFGAIETPIVAAVSGWALGPGCELAFACDMVIASEKATFGQPEVTLGLIPGGGAAQHLTRVIGKHKAMELILTGRRFSTDQAYRWGLINARAKRQTWRQEAQDLAHQVATRAPLAVRYAKQAVLAAEREPLEQALETERRLFGQAMATEDRVEAADAIQEGREPRFEGR